jgi:hypothetical protein
VSLKYLLYVLVVEVERRELVLTMVAEVAEVAH